MCSLRFPLWFSQPSNRPHRSQGSSSPSSYSAAAAVGVGIGLSLSITHNFINQRNPLLLSALNSIFSNFRPHCSIPMMGSISLANDSSAATEPRTGMSFPSILNNTQRLLGIGLRKKSILVKNIDVYAFGVYADETDIKNLLSEKYGKLSVSALKENKEFLEDVLEKDIGMTIQLQIVYGRLSIGSVRSAFAESVGGRLQKFGGSDNKELLNRFTSLLKDEYKIPKGTVIDISRDKDHLLRITIDGKDAGSIQSKLLCRSLFDLYVGEDPFDKQAKENIEQNLASLVIQ
ncbi:fatty-acid-binding protein 1 [Macadamia integrifolia]|uniref:fatty-acid-binding protein 1 n=1 Tax=Macadamia integrifolia TaxID=60698 RepID=UPI001C4F6F4C|nr:fatty-acid-binding protein 1 [Macadamia integrifolia]